jgi:hypothetical protein
MDVEGAEPMVLAGGGHFFDECRPVATAEINSPKLSRLNKKPEDIFKFFRERDYDLFMLNDETRQLYPIDHTEGGDVVFIPKEQKGSA